MVLPSLRLPNPLGPLPGKKAPDRFDQGSGSAGSTDGSGSAGSTDVTSNQVTDRIIELTTKVGELIEKVERLHTKVDALTNTIDKLSEWDKFWS